jgi:hypothetical protein
MKTATLGPDFDDAYVSAYGPVDTQPEATSIDKWVINLLDDLATDDFPLVMMDLVQLQTLVKRERRRAVEQANGYASSLADYFSPFTPKDTRPEEGDTAVVIYGLDGENAIDICQGPEVDGSCPRTLTPEGCVQCAGMWLGAGWKFKAAEDAKACPVAMLGLA